MTEKQYRFWSRLTWICAFVGVGAWCLSIGARGMKHSILLPILVLVSIAVEQVALNRLRGAGRAAESHLPEARRAVFALMLAVVAAVILLICLLPAGAIIYSMFER